MFSRVYVALSVGRYSTLEALPVGFTAEGGYPMCKEHGALLYPLSVSSFSSGQSTYEVLHSVLARSSTLPWTHPHVALLAKVRGSTCMGDATPPAAVPRSKMKSEKKIRIFSRAGPRSGRCPDLAISRVSPRTASPSFVRAGSSSEGTRLY